MSRNRRSLTHVSRQLFNTPVLVTEPWACTLLAAARSELNVDLILSSEGTTLDKVAMEALQAQAMADVDVRDDRRAGKVYDVVNGVAIIPIEGTLTRSWGLDPSSGFTGYDGIKTKFVSAMEDEDVSAIMLDIDSPGGAVAGLFDLCDLMYAYRQDSDKIVGAIANEQACSAAFALFTCATPGYRFVPRTGDIGSVGVLMMYTNVEKALQQDGVDVTIFRAGKMKARMNPYEQIPKEIVDKVNEELEEIRTLFIDTAARNLARPGDDVSTLKKTIRETEGLTYIGSSARAVGLADEVGSEDQLWTLLTDRRIR